MFKIDTLNGKGRSVIALQNLQKGTTIIKETPLLYAEDAYDAIYQLYNTYDIETHEDEELKQYQQKQFESLIPYELDSKVINNNEINEHIKTLPNYMQDFFNNIDSKRLRLLIAKFYRNAFRNNNDKISRPSSAVLIEGALLNHSCNNNIDFYVSKNGDYIFETNRNINEGEELCDTYIDTTLSFKKRQLRFLTQYNFICTCIKCTNKT